MIEEPVLSNRYEQNRMLSNRQNEEALNELVKSHKDVKRYKSPTMRLINQKNVTVKQKEILSKFTDLK